jgi:cation diffusion facilitator CzcD-associated flavoprotein CzcO
LHNFPGKFAPVVFDSRFEVGGLWNTGAAPTKARDASDPVTLDPRMRTNLSRFTVAFSDLAWESVIEDDDIPIFPQASQVGQYLASYAQRYIPKDAFRLGSYVRQTKRLVQPGSSTKWRVFWDQKRYVSN